MKIKDTIAKIKPGDPTLVVDEKATVDYVQKVAKENGIKLSSRKQEEGGWELVCQGKSCLVSS
jgi:TusA-related sulfurtransferase